MAKYVETFFDRDEAGCIHDAGVIWTERSSGGTFLHGFLAVLCLVGVVVIAGMASFGMLPPGQWGLWVLGGCAVGFAGLALFSVPERLLAFRPDGRMGIPLGLEGWGWRKTIGGSHANVSSIEARALPTKPGEPEHETDG